MAANGHLPGSRQLPDLSMRDLKRFCLEINLSFLSEADFIQEDPELYRSFTFSQNRALVSWLPRARLVSLGDAALRLSCPSPRSALVS